MGSKAVKWKRPELGSRGSCNSNRRLQSQNRPAMI